MFVKPTNVLLVILRTQTQLVTMVLNSDLLSRCMKKPFANFHQTGSVPSLYRRLFERTKLGPHPGQYLYQVYQCLWRMLPSSSKRGRQVPGPPSLSRVIVSVRESAETMDHILCVGQPVDQDSDGVNLAPKRQLNLVQVNTVADHVVIFDDQTTPAITTTDCRTVVE